LLAVLLITRWRKAASAQRTQIWPSPSTFLANDYSDIGLWPVSDEVTVGQMKGFYVGRGKETMA